jgi:hypothetical protein
MSTAPEIQPDPSIAAAHFAAILLENTYSTILSFGKKTYVRATLKKQLETYAKTRLETESLARSFFHGGVPVYIYSFYVPIGLSTINGKWKIDRASARELFSYSKRSVIQGSGGSGKSVILRHLYLETLNKAETIPILLELRDFNKANDSIFAKIKSIINVNGIKLDDSDVEKCLEKGLLSLFIDGFDELNRELRDDVSKEIIDIGRRFPECAIVVTSRLDDIFQGWRDFPQIHVSPLTLEQAIELVEKTPMEDELKRRFIEDLSDGLFEKHQSFLSNPLLLSIMLVTYHDSADIPRKLSVFYARAYDALFQRHDAWKGGYNRQRLTKHDIHDFAKLFSAFCLFSYDKRLFSFGREKAIELIKLAEKTSSIHTSVDDFLTDCTQAVCLLVQDGLELAFSHRSFQEYFVARFICDAESELKVQLVNKFCKNRMQDNVARLLYELQPEFIEKELFIPAIREIFEGIGYRTKKASRLAHLTFLKKSFSSLVYEQDRDGSASIRGSRDYDLKPSICGELFFIYDCTKDLSDTKFFTPSKRTAPKNLMKIGEEVSTSTLTINSPIVRHLYSSTGGFSALFLETMRDIKIAIEEKHSTTSTTLESLLKGR